MTRIFIGFIILSLNLMSCTLTDNTFWITHRSARDLAELQNATDSGLITDEAITNASTEGPKPYHNLNFWVLRDDDDATESSSESILENLTTISVQSTTAEKEGSTTSEKGTLSDEPWREYEMNQLIFLNRNNCDLEIQVREAHDMKIKIMYETLQNGVIGECQVALHGKSGILLAVLISNVQLSAARDSKGRNVSNEILRVVSRTNHFNITLFEYRGWEEYYPVILTDTDQAFLILSYHGITSSKQKSSFDLEVFNYYKNENRINPMLNDNPGSNYGSSKKSTDNIYITTDIP